jgi:hypothetical protein
MCKVLPPPPNRSANTRIVDKWNSKYHCSWLVGVRTEAIGLVTVDACGPLLIALTEARTLATIIREGRVVSLACAVACIPCIHF